MSLGLMVIYQRDFGGGTLHHLLRIDPERISGRQVGWDVVGDLRNYEDEDKERREDSNLLDSKRRA